MMSLNLNQNNRIRLIIGLLLISLIPVQLSAQSNSEYSFGISLTPSSSYALINGGSWTNYLDSSNSNQVLKNSLQVHAWVNKAIGKEMEFQIGLGYANIGFRRNQENLKFKAYTYPGIATGMVEDLSGSEKQINYFYQFRYLQIPVLMNLQLARSKDFKYRYSFTGGLTLNALLQHRIIAETIKGYYIDGQTKFTLDSTGFQARPLSLQLNLGMKADFKIDKKTKGFVQPMLAFYPISISSAERTINPFMFLLSFGINYSFLD
ncbi:MAG: hypothetical protein ACOVP1_11395 [Bacteroidia bacterium]